MILKERSVPLMIKKLKALLRRLPNDHVKRKRIEDDLAKYNAGYQGEKSLDYHLSFFDKDKYIIIHDVRLSDHEKRFFQIDTIILSPNLFLLLEVKNIAGTLYFDSDFNQLVRSLDGKEEAFVNPILQVERQKSQLHSWLVQQKYPNYPIVPLVVLSNPKTILKASAKQREIAQKVIHSELLFQKIKELESTFQKELYTIKETRKIAKLLIKANQFFDQDILDKYKILENELLTGVICENCNSFSMERNRGKWICLNCYVCSKSSHQFALEDYFLLYGNSITNKKLRNFLHIESVYDASRLLSSLNLYSEGTNKGAIYYFSEPL